MEQLEVRSPYDGHLISSVPYTSDEDIENSFTRMYERYRDRDSWPSKAKRLTILRKFGVLLKENSEDLARLAAEEGGKPLTDSLIEVKRAINGIDVAITEVMNMRGTEIPMDLNEASKGHIAYTMLEPCGVVLGISAFNHPINLVIHQVIPAIAAGCPVMIKPAPSTPLTCLKIVELLHEAGSDDQWCKAIICDNDTTARLAADHRLGFVTFIGSARVGWNIRSSLAPGVRCSLEHGGAAPVILEPDADIERALPGLLKAGYYHAGQVCVSVQRIFVHKSIVSKLSDRFTEMVKALKVGDPLDPDTAVGPLIRHGEVDRVHEWVTEAVKGGAKLLTGGEKISESCYQPTLLLDPPKTSKVCHEEIFGPVVTISSYEERNEAVEQANSLPFVFQAAVYTERIDAAIDLVRRLKATAVMVNQHTAFRVDWMPFGGAGMSGLGVGGFRYAMRDMTHEKLMVIKL